MIIRRKKGEVGDWYILMWIIFRLRKYTVPAQRKHLLIFGSSISVRVEVLDGFKYDLFYKASPENYIFEVYVVKGVVSKG